LTISEADGSFKLARDSKKAEKPRSNKPKSDSSKSDSPPRYTSQSAGDGYDPGDGVKEAGERLCRLIDPKRVLDPRDGSRRPLVTLSFDEAPALTDAPKCSSWTLFSELRRVLRETIDHPIFSLFLSTAGKFHLLSPEIRSDPSGRVTNHELSPLHPISEICFDDLAYPAKERAVPLDRAATTGWISHLGRPLCVRFTHTPFKSSSLTTSSRFGAYYDGLRGDKKAELLLFAKQKLLNGYSTLVTTDSRNNRTLNSPGTLACLSIRFALEFNADSISRAVAYTQVERHMRLCLAATTGFERLITLAGSEPLLAEAAEEPMRDGQMNPVRYLAEHSGLNCVDRGRRGELVAAPIAMQARDAALRRERRRVSVCEFMEALLPRTRTNVFKARCRHFGAKEKTGHSARRLRAVPCGSTTPSRSRTGP
jgi:hypothetical protein